MEGLDRFDSAGFDEPELLVAFLLAGLLQLLRPHVVSFVSRYRSQVGLTRREAEVLACVAEGKTNAEIGTTLSIAPGTVKKHLDHIYEKLGVGTRTEAVVKAMTLPSAPA